MGTGLSHFHSIQRFAGLRKSYYASLVTLLFCAGAAKAQDDGIDGQDTVEAPSQETVIPSETNLPPEIDLDAPLTNMDDFGVDWPEFDTPINGLADNEEIAESDVPDDVPGDTSEDGSDGAAILADQDTLGPSTREPLQGVSAQAANSGLVDVPLPRKITDYDVDVAFSDGLISSRDRRDLLQRFNALSSLETLNDDDSNIAQIRRRANLDRALLLRLLRIYGHYDGIVEPLFAASSAVADAQNDAADNNVQISDDILVNFLVTAGPLYRFGDINLGNLRDAGDDYPYFIRTFGLASGDVANSDDIVAGEERLAQALAENGYAFANLAPAELVIDHQALSADLSLEITPGEKYRFGNINVGDDPLLSARHLLRIARFDTGDIFRASRVEDLRRAILATGLVSSVSITAVPAEDKEIDPESQPKRLGVAGADTPAKATEIVDLNVDIAPAPLRTIAGELGFGTGEGFRIAASWEHRNFFPPEGLVRVRGVVGTQEQLLGATYQRNNFRQRDTVLNINALIANVQRDAFDARTISLSANIQRQTNLIFQKKWTWSAGVEFVLTDESDIAGPNDTGRETFGIAALPASLAYDGSDDLLDPSKGFRVAILVSPEVSLITGNVGYFRSQFDASFYQPFSDNIILAGRTRLASITGASTFAIAPSRRFYSGGGGSVRGFGFQDVGPIDINGDPVGGRSLAEFSLEARVRFGEFGVVPFIDAGNVYDNSFPTFRRLRYGAGIGLRYYSSFGPLRLDVGTPINPGPNDAAIGVYVSLGQAF